MGYVWRRVRECNFVFACYVCARVLDVASVTVHLYIDGK